MFFPPRLSDGPDKWEWILNGSKVFLVSDIKSHLANHRFSHSGYVFKWNNWVPRKVSILSWRAPLDRILVCTALTRRNITVASISCPICGFGEESVDHIFIDCGFAHSIWAAISQWCNIPPIFAFSFKDLLDIHVYMRGSVSLKKAFYGVVLVAIWCIWRVTT
uniref:uncharacterized protein LOC122590843 n=1 Tax=Erigeron canadensis TaxID=72917 RepID=UPI001CB9ACB1|nr:uncharacterized protein LOC122590843 [Erigeron canadensis]